MKVEISIPTSLDEITVEQYQRFAAIDANADYDYRARKMLEIFCGVSDTLLVKKKDVDAVSKALNEAFNKPYGLIPLFKLEDTEFGFIPNLEDITFGEFIDLDTLSDWQTIHKALAVLYRPVTERHKERYRIKPYEGTAKYGELMKKAPASVAIGALVFFWTLSRDLFRASLTSLEREKKKETTPQDPNSIKSMDGLLRSINLVEGTLQKNRQLPDYQLANAFISYLYSTPKTGSKLKNLIKEETK